MQVQTPGEYSANSGPAQLVPCQGLSWAISKRFFHAYHNTDFTKRHEPFRCFQCDKIFPSRSKLSRHAQRAHYEVIFKCGLCQEKFTFKDNLDRHWKAIHKGYKESDEIFSCDTCGMKFPVKHNYTRHLKKHDEPKETFNCDTCGMKLSVNINGYPFCSDERLIWAYKLFGDNSIEALNYHLISDETELPNT